MPWVAPLSRAVRLIHHHGTRTGLETGATKAVWRPVPPRGTDTESGATRTSIDTKNVTFATHGLITASICFFSLALNPSIGISFSIPSMIASLVTWSASAL